MAAFEAEGLSGREFMTRSDRSAPHWQVGRFRALEDAIDVARRAPILVGVISPIGDQAAAGNEGTFEVDSG